MEEGRVLSDHVLSNVLFFGSQGGVCSVQGGWRCSMIYSNYKKEISLVLVIHAETNIILYQLESKRCRTLLTSAHWTNSPNVMLSPASSASSSSPSRLFIFAPMSAKVK